MTRLWAAALWLVSGLWYLVTEAVVAAHVPGYTYAVDFISDLGKPGYSAMAGWMNGAFIQQGVSFALAGALAYRTVRRRPGSLVFLCLAIVYGVGSAMVGLFHGGVGDAAHTAHVAGAVTAIVGGNLAIITAGGVLLRRRRGGAFGIISVTLGAAGLLCGALLLVNGAAGNVVPFDGGVWERASVYTIIAWQLLAGYCVVRVGLRRNRHHPGVVIR
jgi:hypothetical membrane protein